MWRGAAGLSRPRPQGSTMRCAARVGGAPEIVRDEVTGWLYPPQRPEEGARRLRQLAADAACVARMGAAAAAHLAAELGMDKMVVDHRRLYLSLAGPC